MNKIKRLANDMMRSVCDGKTPARSHSRPAKPHRSSGGDNPTLTGWAPILSSKTQDIPQVIASAACYSLHGRIWYVQCLIVSHSMSNETHFVVCQMKGRHGDRASHWCWRVSAATPVHPQCIPTTPTPGACLMQPRWLQPPRCNSDADGWGESHIIWSLPRTLK